MLSGVVVPRATDDGLSMKYTVIVIRTHRRSFTSYNIQEQQGGKDWGAGIKSTLLEVTTTESLYHLKKKKKRQCMDLQDIFHVQAIILVSLVSHFCY